MTGFTKGPWTVDAMGDIVSGPYNVCIPYSTKPEDKSLIAAAPDLYDALECVMDELAEMYRAVADTKADARARIDAEHCMIAARAALAKARGE